MRLGIYGGTFNPPHIGHVRAAEAADERLGLDVLLIIPSGIPPHKTMPASSPTGAQRLEMARLAFGAIPGAEISDIEIRKNGVSYTAETIAEVRAQYPGAELYLIMGSDMFLTLDMWRDAESILRGAVPAVLSRGTAEDREIADFAGRLRERYGVRTTIIDNDVTDASSTDLRALLKNRGGVGLFDDATYSYIISSRLYGAKPDFAWLREKTYARVKPKRIAHIAGCEQESVRLAEHWGADVDEAREAGILHDITKYLELDDQLKLCEKYGIMTDNIERNEVKLLHSKTGAAIARAEFGASDAVYNAIMWHTTGKADMALLEKILYIADYMEPTREFDGVEELRRLAYEDLDMAVVRGLQMSIEDMTARGIVPHTRTQEAINWLLPRLAKDGRE